MGTKRVPQGSRPRTAFGRSHSVRLWLERIMAFYIRHATCLLNMTKQQRASPQHDQRRADTQSHNSLLRLFGSSRELLAKSNADLSRLVDSLSCSKDREALWALMDCAITVFHIGDWIRATHVDHHATSLRFAQGSKWIRMTRDLCHAAKHGDLKWEDSQAAMHGSVLMKLECDRRTASDDHPPNTIWAITQDGSRHSVVKVLQEAISDWTRFLDQRGI